MPKYTLVGIDGNAFNVMGYVTKCMKKEGYNQEDINKYLKEAQSSDYNNLLSISAAMIDKLNSKSTDILEIKEKDSDSENKVLKDFSKEEIEKQEKITSDLYEKYVPVKGQGDSRISQILVAYSKLVYKWYNDGDVYDNTYNMRGWANDISGSANWLYKYVPETQKILEQIKVIETDSEYSNLIRNLEFLLNNEEFLKKYENLPVLGDAYHESGPFEFVEDCDDDEDCNGNCWDCYYRDDCECDEE